MCIRDRPEPKPAKKPEVVDIPPVEKRKFRVRVGKDQYRYFETKEEAVAFAKGLAESRGVNVIVK